MNQPINPNIKKTIHRTEVYVEPSRTSAMELFCENS